MFDGEVPAPLPRRLVELLQALAARDKRGLPKQLQPPRLTKISRHTSPNTTTEPVFGEWNRANCHGRRSLRETAFFYSNHPATSRRLV